MRVNAINNVSFKARVSDKFVNDGRRYYAKEKNPALRDRFDSKVDEYKLFGTRDMEVIYQDSYKDGKRMHALYITQPGETPVLLTEKDSFRKVITKFLHVNEYEFTKKVEQARNSKR